MQFVYKYYSGKFRIGKGELFREGDGDEMERLEMVRQHI